MTPQQRYARRWLVFRLLSSLVALGLLVGGIAVVVSTPATQLGFVMVLVSLALQFVRNFRARRTIRDLLAESGQRWWYNPRTGEVLDGPVVRGFGIGLDGPYGTREEAERAPEIARERAARWNAED